MFRLHLYLQEHEIGEASTQVPTRKRSMRPRCPRVQLEETYYLSPLDGQGLDEDDCSDGAADSAEEEEAAALLLGMGHFSVPALAAAAAAPGNSPGSPLKDGQGAGSCFRCSSCRQPAVLRGEKRPTFFCASCPSKGGAQKRAQRALHGSSERVVSVSEAVELLQAKRPQQQLNGANQVGHL